MKKWLPVLVMIVLFTAFTAFAYGMSRADNVPAADMALGDPARVGASQRAQAVSAQTPPAQPEALADAAAGADTLPSIYRPAVQPEKVPVPLFWMALGAACTGVGIFVATRGNR